ncbi:sodium cotransporter iodide, partial [Mytilus galloprovincialis]
LIFSFSFVVTDFPFWASVLCISAASVVYTAIGTIDSGGPREVVDIAVSSGRLNLFNFDPDPTVRHTFWGLVIGSIIRLIDMTFRQATVQRICAVEKQSDANK